MFVYRKRDANLSRFSTHLQAAQAAAVQRRTSMQLRQADSVAAAPGVHRTGAASARWQTYRTPVALYGAHLARPGDRYKLNVASATQG
jgi:hypothetical protein